MDNLLISLIAIKNYNPKDGVYLRVMGEGNNQYLKAEKINWLGRILMWFGCSTASMRKVACYLYKNIHAITQTRTFNLNDQENALGKLIGRIQKYDQSHPSRIQYYTCTITSAYNEARFTKKHKPIARTPAISQSVITKPSDPPGTNIIAQTPPQTIISTPPLAKTAAPQTIAPPPPMASQTPSVITQAPTQAPPAIAQISAVAHSLQPQDYVEKYNAQRHFINNAGNFLLTNKGNNNPSDPFTPADAAKSLKAMETVQKLIEDSSKDPMALQALISEISLTEIEYYSYFALHTPYTYAEQSHQELFKDVFELLKKSQTNGSSPLLESILKCMTDAQLKKLISCVGKTKNVIACIRVGEYLPPVSTTLKDSYFCEMSKCYFLEAFQMQSHPKRIKIYKELAYHRLLGIFKEPFSSARDGKIITYIEENLWHRVNNALEDQAFLDRLSPREKESLCGYYVKLPKRSEEILSTLLINNLLSDPTTRHIVFKEIISYQMLNCTPFISIILKNSPDFDKEYFQWCFQYHRQDDLKSYLYSICENNVPSRHSAINEVSFINSIPEDDLLMLGVAIAEKIETFYWRNYNLVISRIFNDSKIALKLFKKLATLNHPFNTNHNCYRIPYYYKEVLQNMVGLHAIEQAMTTTQKDEWAKFKIN